jgi:hypothetical protein
MEPSDLQAALFWLGFHLRRNLRKRPFRLAGGGLAVAVLVLRYVARTPPDGIAGMVVLLFAPLLALFYGTGAMREEIEDQTLTYSFSRPVGRHWLYAARVLAAAVPVALLTVPAALFAGLPDGADVSLRYGFGAALATITYGSFFALAGQLIKWPAWFGLAFLAFWEAGVGTVPGFLGRLTLVTHVRALMGLRPWGGPWTQWWQPPAVPVSVTVLVLVTAATLWIGGQIVRRREFVLTK